MRRVTMVLAAAAVLLALFVPGALARTVCASSFSGDDRPNTLTGDRCYNEINGLGGDDVISGKGGDDTLSGDGNGDRISGGGGADELRGGPGRDRIYSGAFDGERDVVVCGAGHDFASIGEFDRAADDCEEVAFTIE